jgi:hypothetical protein
MAVGGHTTQPRLQVKTISVALQTATQTPKPMFLVQPSLSSYTARQNAFQPLGNLASPAPYVATAICAVSLYSYWTSSMPSFFAVRREEVS